jgi:Glycosyltransferase family 87
MMGRAAAGLRGRAVLPRRAAWGVALVAAAVLQIVVLAVWAWRFGPAYGEDFDAHWAAARLLLDGHRGAMYSMPSEVAAVHAAGGFGVAGLNHPGWGPVALATALPFVLLPVRVAVALWAEVQLVALGAAVLLAVRTLSPRAPAAGMWSTRALVAALGTPGLAALVVLGQWEGIAALLLVLCWRDTRLGERRRAALWLLLLAGAVPHLAIGMVVYQLARWGRAQARTLAGGGALLGLGALALLGPAGVAGWVGQVAALGHEVPSQDTDGLVAVTSALFGRSAGLAASAAVLAIAAALAACWVLGRRDLSTRTALAVSCLSLLVSPHLFHYSVCMLAPLVVASLVGERSESRRQVLAVLWTCLGVLSVAGLNSGHVWWQPLVPLALLGVAVAAVMPQLVTAPWAAEVTSAAYLAKTPRA